MDKYQKNQADWYDDIQNKGIEYVLDAIESMDEAYISCQRAELAVAQHVQDLEDELRARETNKVWLIVVSIITFILAVFGSTLLINRII